MQFGLGRQITSVCKTLSMCSVTTQHLTARSSRSCLALLLGLMFLAALSGCGPASSDNAPSLGANASVSGQPLSKQGSSAGNSLSAPATQVASSMSPAPGNEIGAASAKGTGPVGDSSQAVPVSSSRSAEVLEPLVVPAWIAKDLESSDVGTRLRALDKWVQTAPPGADDPLILALENKDERVRARAMELIEQNWARAADAEQ
jgi:hypothetical protein